MNARQVKVSVLLSPQDAARLDSYCTNSGHKKSTLIAKLVRDYLDAEATRQPVIRDRRSIGQGSEES
jgi:metal-responsive CopG/Arc/MetJ family transcriptional regulator